ncbi:hypothetical protein J3459_014741 [Metarhizium acridum]|uniref:uncharacterized protein n=1 Tax=Metarhizium acridum TaxID=92637 RepID=UPI001C6BCFC9|nr:hypothetical protein J3458_014429 [Metarhizium acridum]KAG8414441.1 hypothetical protein J3459_014741 [Metarhizium acridum]
MCMREDALIWWDNSLLLYKTDPEEGLTSDSASYGVMTWLDECLSNHILGMNRSVLMGESLSTFLPLSMSQILIALSEPNESTRFESREIRTLNT